MGRGEEVAGKTATVSGSGNVAQYTVEKLNALGAKPVTLSDSNGSVELTNPDFARGSFGGVVGLTESSGRRPLGDGTRRLTVFGIQDQPKVERKDGTVKPVTSFAVGKALVVPYAEMAMDVDKPHQFELMEKYLSERIA